MKITKYIHHDKEVSVFEELKGQHREHCLCYAKCKFFKPNTLDNCPIARGLFEYDVSNGVTTPVFECATYAKA